MKHEEKLFNDGHFNQAGFTSLFLCPPTPHQQITEVTEEERFMLAADQRLFAIIREDSHFSLPAITNEITSS